MKKIISMLFIILISMPSFSYYSAYSGLDDGHIILSEKAEDIRPLASLTKLMTVLVTLEAIDKGEITLKDLVKIDKKVNIGESSIPLEDNDKISVEELLKAALIYSANNAAYALSLYVAGSEDRFVELMNIKARELGMNSTTYYTSTGLPTKYTKKELDISTAKDQYILAKKVIKDKRILEWANQKYVKIKGEYFRSRNKILGKNGNMGLKTGYHIKAGFNMIGLFKIYNNNLIVVTLGDVSLRDRFISQLGISNMFKDSLVKIYSKDDYFKEIKIKDSVEGSVRTKLEKDFYYYKKEYLNTKIELSNINGMVKKGQEIGVFKIYDKYKLLDEINIISEDDTTLMSIWSKVKTWF